MSLNVSQTKRLRGKILELVLDGHRKQLSRYDDVSLWSMLRDLGWKDLSLNELLTACQDLKARGYLTFHFDKNKRTGEVILTQIEIQPIGVDLFEGTREDPAVTLIN